ncbi:beta family protein [Candidatus Frankia alpina]|uniref:beta family protein n=1 Tax=Candidatus Frankia alpina TaxID=2699483 RepID=UPI001F238537|nr:beta family protein [Candidatus Frankia alpina]
MVAKLGERNALRDLPPAARAGLTPLLVVPPIPINRDTGEPSKTVDDHLRDLTKDVSAKWAGPAFVDLGYFDDAQASLAEHPLEAFVDKLAKTEAEPGMAAIPVTSPNRSPQYQDAVVALHRRYGRGVCFRLSPDEWPALDKGTALKKLMGHLRIGPGKADLVLDCGSKIGDSSRVASSRFESELMGLPVPRLWRSITVAGTSAPVGMAGIPRGLTAVERVEWATYLDLVDHLGTRTPGFGDYAIANPDADAVAFPPGGSISAALRYTENDRWIVAKGGLFKGKNSTGGAAMNPVAQLLCSSPHFAGAQHCSADAWIADAALGASGGGPAQWRQHGTLHHLVTVSEQLASLFAP